MPDEALEVPCKYTSALQDEVNRYVFEDHSHDPDGAFEERTNRLLQIFEQALVQLDREGFFGTGNKRHQVLLKVDRGDCGSGDEEYEHMLKVIKRINPPESTATFFALVNEEKKKEKARNRRKEKIIKLAEDFLQREKQVFVRCCGAHLTGDEERVSLLAKLIPQRETPKELWEVIFEREKLPAVAFVTRIRAQIDERWNLFTVVVDPRTGNCAIKPEP